MSRLLISECMRLVERAHRMPKGTLLVKRKWVPLVHSRQSAMLLAYENGHSFCSIARAMNLDHTTVIYGINKAKKRKATVIERQQQEGGHNDQCRSCHQDEARGRSKLPHR